MSWLTDIKNKFLDNEGLFQRGKFAPLQKLGNNIRTAITPKPTVRANPYQPIRQSFQAPQLPVLQPPKPTFKTDAATKLNARLDQIKMFGTSTAQNMMDNKGIVRQGQFKPLAPAGDKIKDFINKNTIFANPESNNGDNFWGVNGRGSKLQQKTPKQAMIEASPIGMLEQTTRNQQAFSPYINQIVNSRDEMNRSIDNQPKAKWIGQNIVKPAVNTGATLLDQFNQSATNFSDAYRDLAYNTDGNKNPVKNIAQILKSSAGAYAGGTGRTLIPSFLNSVANTDFTKGVTSGYNNIVTGTEQQGNNGGDSFTGKLGRFIGGIAGWKKNPINEAGQIFMDKFIPYQDVIGKDGKVIIEAWQPIKNKFMNFIATRGTRGMIEDIIDNLSRLEDDKTDAQNTVGFIKNELLGALSEIVSEKAMDIGKDAFNKYYKGDVANIVSDLSGKPKINPDNAPTPKEIAWLKWFNDKYKSSEARGRVNPPKAEVEKAIQISNKLNYDEIRQPGQSIRELTYAEHLANENPEIKLSPEAQIQKYKERGYGERQISQLLRKQGIDTTNLNLKGDVTTIDSVLKNKTFEAQPITVKGVDVSDDVNSMIREGWTTDQIDYAIKLANKSNVGKPDKNWGAYVRGILKSQNPKQAATMGRPLPPEPSADEIAKMDKNMDFAKPKTETTLKNEPEMSKVPTTEEIVNPRASSEVVEPKKEPKKIIKTVLEPKTVVETTPDKFRGEESRIKHKTTDTGQLKNRKLASAISTAKRLDEWEMNGNKIFSRKADEAWRKVADIESGNYKEKPITPESTEQDFQEGKKALNNLIGKFNRAETQATMMADKFGLFDIKKNQTDTIIGAIEKTNPKDTSYSPEEVKQIEQVKEFWDKSLEIGKRMGLNINETKNYFTHIYSEFQSSKGFGTKNLSQTTPFSKSRKYSSYKEALEKAGLTKAFNNIAEFGTYYLKKNITTKAKIDFLKSLPFKNVDDVKGNPDYKKIQEIRGVNIKEDDRYLPTKLAEMVDNYFQPTNINKILKTSAAVGKTTQDFVLNAGVPFTPINYLGITQSFKEFQTELGQAAMGQKNPFKMHSIKNFLRSFSPQASMKFAKDHAKDVIQLQGRYKINTEYNTKDLLNGNFSDMIKDKKWSEAFDRLMGGATFKRMMPQHVISSFVESKATFMKNGMSEKQATNTALDLVGKLYGLSTVQSKYTGSGFEKWVQNENVSNALKSVILAKDFKLQMSKMFVNMAKALKNPTAPENQGVIAYGIGLILTKVAMEVVNKLSTGKFMEENPENLKDKAIIKIPGTESNLTLATVPGVGFVPKTMWKIGKGMVKGEGRTDRYLSSFGSIPLSLGYDLSTNKDYFGNNIWDSADTTGEKAKKIYEHSSQKALSPYVSGIATVKNILKKEEGIDVTDSEINKILKSVEFPMSYLSDKRIGALYYYDKKKQEYDKLTEDEKVIFDKIEKKSDDFAFKQRDAVADAQDYINYPNVLKAKKNIAIETAKANGVDVDPLYKLSDDKIKTFYQIQGLKNNRDAQKDLKNANQWYSDFQDERSEHFKKLIASGAMKEQENEYPQAKPETQKKLDYLKELKTPEIKKKQDAYYALPLGTGARTAYLKANPDLKKYWETKNNFQDSNPDIQEYWDKVNDYYLKIDEAFGIIPKEEEKSGSGWQNWGNYKKKSDYEKLQDALWKLKKKDHELSRKLSKKITDLLSKTPETKKSKTVGSFFNSDKLSATRKIPLTGTVKRVKRKS